MQAAVYIHLVWATWERRSLLNGEFEQRIHRSIAATAEELKAKVIAIGGTDDHTHLLVQLPTSLSIAELVQRGKGSSAHLATHAFTTASSFKWQPGYGAVSVSPRHIDQVTRYIANQRQHHAANTVLPLLEDIR
ncbi:MAG TPA: IS200/IS605 family transposase [Thermomicrobiales bacterium]|jgi:REP element-mobilizing transposase RayT